MAKLLIRLMASMGLIGLVLWFVDPLQVLSALGRPDPLWLAAGFAAACGASLASALRWRMLALWLENKGPWQLFLLAYWRGIAANTILPGGTLGGDALRAVHLQRAGNTLASSAMSVVLDRVSGLWVLVVISLATFALALATGLMPAHVLPLPWQLAAGLALLATITPLILWQLSTATRHRLPRRLDNLLAAIHERPHPLRQYLQQLVGSALVQALSILAFACSGQAVGLTLPLWLYFIAAGPIFILAALPVSVGGWGTREAASVLALGLFTAPRELAMAASILYGLYAALQGILGALTLIQTATTTGEAQ